MHLADTLHTYKGLPLSPHARINLTRLTRLVGNAHAVGHDPNAIKAADVTLAAFEKSHQVVDNIWIPRSVIKAGKAVIKSKHKGTTNEVGRALFVQAAIGKRPTGFLAAILGIK